MNWKKILVGEWSWKRPFQTIAWVYLLLALFAWFFADRLIFQPPGTPYCEDRSHFKTLGEGRDAIAIYHQRGAFERSAGPTKPTLLWSHGNAQNLESLRPALINLSRLGYSVISYDYPGYGESGGTTSEEGCYRAIRMTFDHLTDDLGIAPKDIILVGQSVGSGPTCWLASKEDHRAVVLISPFLSAFRTVTKIPIFPGDRFPNLNTIKKFDSPLLVIHGEDDRTIPFEHGKKLFELSPSKHKIFHPVEDAGHNDLFLQASFDFFTLLKEFHQMEMSMIRKSAG